MLSLMIKKRGGTPVCLQHAPITKCFCFFKEGSFSKEILVSKRNLQGGKFEKMMKYEEIQRNLKNKSKNQNSYIDGFMSHLSSSFTFVDIDAMIK